MGFIEDIFEDLFEDIIDFFEDIIDFGKDLIGAIGGIFGFMPDVPDFNLGQGQSGEGMIQGILVNKTGATGHIPLVYGTRRVGGSVIFISTNGESNKYLYVAMTLCEGQVPSDAIEKIILEDRIMDIGTLNHGEVVSPNDADKYSGRVQFQFFDGRDDQIASSILKEAPGWSDQHRLQGISYIAARYQWDQIETREDAEANPFKGGVPRLNVIMKGKKVFDATTLGSSHATAYGSESLIHTNNPVSCLLDYMRNPRFGKGLNNDSFDWQSWGVAADLCNQDVQFVAGGDNQKVFTCNAAIDTSVSLMSNIKILLSGFRGMMPYTQGLYKLNIEHAGDDTDITSTSTPSVVLSIDNDDIVGGMSLEGEVKENRLNRCIVTYTDIGTDENPTFKPNDAVFPDRQDSDQKTSDDQYLAEDGNIRLEKKITMPHITSREEALQFAEVSVKKSRNAKIVSFTTTLRASNVTVGDLISVTNEHIGLSNKIFRVLSVNVSNQGAINFSAVEHTPANYAMKHKPGDIDRPQNNPPDDDPYAGQRADLTLTNAEGERIAGQTFYFISASFTKSSDPLIERYYVYYKLSQEPQYSLNSIIGKNADRRVHVYDAGILGQNYDFKLVEEDSFGNMKIAETILNHTLTRAFRSATTGLTEASGAGGSSMQNVGADALSS